MPGEVLYVNLRKLCMSIIQSDSNGPSHHSTPAQLCDGPWQSFYAMDPPFTNGMEIWTANHDACTVNPGAHLWYIMDM